MEQTKKQTAVEWLFKWMIDNKDLIIEERLQAFEQAKEMEKEQNKYFHDHGFYTGRCTDNDKNGSFEYWINNYKND